LAEPTAAKPGDRASCEAFVTTTYVELYRWFCRLTGSTDRAADLTQDAYAEFWGSLGRVPPGVAHRTWLFAIGRNLWHKRLRDRKDFEPAVLSLLEDRSSSIDRPLLDQEFREAARQAVGRLPDDLREAFTLRFWNELGYDEIGHIQGVTAALARWRYFAARKRLHQLLADWDPHADRKREDRHAR
jgi:RNA polymerase sigma-70 factor (ECF subfamily)